MRKLMIHPNPTKAGVRDSITPMVSELYDMGFELYMDSKCECLPDNLEKVNLMPYDRALAIADCLVVIGGDGTILRIALDAAMAKKPVIGINMGRVGFIPELEVTELSLMKAVMEGNFEYEHRMMLDISVVSADGSVKFHSTALNEASISKGTLSKMIQICVNVNDKKTISFAGDGLIVCTPTGSTAYSLAAGGPILEPSCSCIAVTPICPHSINIKSFVLPSEHTVEVTVTPGPNAAYILADGSEPFRLEDNDRIIIEKSSLELSLIRIKGLGFYEIIRKKLSKEGD